MRRASEKPRDTLSLMSFDGEVFLVTGGSRGIGRAIVQRLVVDGAQVFIIDTDARGGREVRRLRASGLERRAWPRGGHNQPGVRGRRCASPGRLFKARAGAA